MTIDDKSILKVDLPDGEYKLYYGWQNHNRGKRVKPTEKVRVENGTINEADFIKAALIYQEKSGLLDDEWIEEIQVHRRGKAVIEYLTGS